MQPETLNIGSASSTRSLRLAAILTIAALLTILIPLSEQAALLALVALLTVVCFGPAWVRWQQGHFDAFETINVMGLIYFVYFGLGAIWAVDDPVLNSYDIYLVPYIPRAVLYCALGLGALLCGYFGPWWHGRVRWKTVTRIRSGALFLVLPTVVGIVGYVADSSLSQARWLGVAIPRGFSALAQLAPLYLYVWGLGCLLVFSGRASPGQRRFFLYGLVPTTVVILSISMTNKSGSMTLIGMPLVALWYARGRLPWKSLVALVMVLIFVVFPFYNTYRGLDPRISKTTRIAMTGEAILDWGAETYLERSVGTAKQRLAMINSVAVVMRDVGRWVPFERGSTIFLPTVAFFIPSYIWPDKPTFTMGREVAETFRVTHILDNETRIEVTVPGELYWNFDLPGILLGMLVWGVAMRWCYRRYAEDEPLDPVRRALHLVVLAQWVHFGSGLAAQTVTLVRTLILLELYLVMARRFDLASLVPTPIRQALTK